MKLKLARNTVGSALCGVPYSAIVFAMWMVAAQCAVAQDDVRLPLYEQDPFDQITVTEKFGGGTYRVLPLQLPEGQLPENPDPADKLVVRPVDQPDTPSEIAWGDIAKVELFEQLLLNQAQTLSTEGKFEQAYDYFAFLHSNYPAMPQLPAATENYIYRNAGVLFQQGQYRHSLTLLENLYAKNPQHKGVEEALTNVINRLLEHCIKEKDYAAARSLLSRATAQRGGRKPPLVTEWEQRLASSADMHLQAARGHIDGDRLRLAHQAIRQAMEIWPELPGAAETSREVAQKYPLLTVGVSRLSGSPMAGRLDRNSRRIRQLSRRSLLELEGYGAGGARYGCQFGNVATAEDRRSVRIELDPHRAIGLTGYDISQRLLSQSSRRNGSFDPQLAALLESVQVQNVFDVRLQIRPHPQPAAVLARLQLAGARPFQPAVESADSAGRRNWVNHAPGGQVRELIEVQYGEISSAIEDLHGGRLDLIERVFPADISRLKQTNGITVETYAAPSIHVLVPNRAKPYAASALFRRAIALGIDRQNILDATLLDGQTVPGCRLISGPLPAGTQTNDPLMYGYDQEIEPLPYQPQLALTLLRVAESELANVAEKQGTQAPALGEVVIGHYDDQVPRTACRQMAQQLAALGLACRVKVLSERESAARDECHFIYEELLITEPLVDAVDLFSQHGIAPPTAYMRLPLKRLVAARSWQQARENLIQLHRLVHTDQTVIPLWQLVDHFAYRNGVEGIGRPVTLYQNIQKWTIENKP